MARVSLVRVIALPRPYPFKVSRSKFTSLQPQFPLLTSPTLLFPKPLSVSVLASASVSASSTVLQPPDSSKSSNVDFPPYLSCSMPHKPLKVAVLLSGGVDSSVALRLLHAAGHSCVAFYLKIWFQVCSFVLVTFDKFSRIWMQNFACDRKIEGEEEFSDIGRF